MRLWFSTPQTWRQLDRPFSLDSLSLPSQRTSRIGLPSQRLSLNLTVPPKNPYSEHLPFHGHQSNTQPEKGGGKSRRFNSNEWSLLKYGVFLGGVAWGRDEKDRELIGDDEGPFSM